jgi:hypothetical protein
MFLVEGNGKAIIYTGDIRGESIIVFIDLQLMADPLQPRNGGSAA